MLHGAGRRTRGVVLDPVGLDSGHGGGYYQPLKGGSYSDRGLAREFHRNPDVRVHEALGSQSAEPPEIPPSWVDPRRWEPEEHHADDWRRPHADQVSGGARRQGARYCDWRGPLPPSEQHVVHSRARGGEEVLPSGFGGGAPQPQGREPDAPPGGRPRRRGGRAGSARGSGGGSAYSGSGSRSGSRSGSSGRRRRGRRRGRSRSRSRSDSRSRSGSRSGSRWSGSSRSRSSASSERTRAKAQELKQKVEATQRQEAAEKQKLGPQRKTRGIDLTDELLPVPGAEAEQPGATSAKAIAKSVKVVPPGSAKSIAVTDETGDLRKVGRQPTVRPADAPKWKTGKARLKLRQDFNKHEINVKSLMEHYDVNRDGTLEPDEFQNMLKDQSRWKKKASNYEMACIMALADTDEDENISTEEVLYALKIWYAYVNMNNSVARLLAPPVSEGPMPNQVLLEEVLTHMNDDYPVSEQEVRHVIESLRFLGATKAHVSMIQMRMAVAAWYLNVERDETPRAHLINIALENTHKQITTGQVNPLGKCFRGNCDPVTVVGFLVLFAICVVHPLVEIAVSDKLHEEPLCFHWITTALKMQGYLSLVWFGMFIWLTTSFECCSPDVKICRQAAIFTFIVVSMLCFAVWAFGLFQVMDSQASRCGLILWQYGNFCFVVMPVLMVLFACMALPCMYCCEYFHNSQIEQTLHEHEHERDLHAGGSV